jgi:ribonucleoside-diphosphate reductase beta chain
MTDVGKKPADSTVAAPRAGILTSSHSYKPFRYPWAYDFWKRQQQIHWMPEEVPLGEDCKDWAAKLNDSSARC